MNSVIDAVAQRLMVMDEGQIRIPEICDATGVNYGSVYHHFGSREGVIDAAMERIFSELIHSDVDGISRVMTGSKTRTDFLASMERFFESQAQGEERQARRQMRIRIVAAALVRPQLRQRISVVQSEVTTVLAGLCAEAQVRGWLRNDVPAHTLAVFGLSAIIGRTLDDVSATPISDDDWYIALRMMFTSFLAA